MGPEYGTEKYKSQVDTIVCGLGSVPMYKDELSSFLMMYILDESFSRAAICEAEKIIRRKLEANPEV